MARDPRTPDEWREAATWASVLLQMDSARHYGLIGGAPPLDVERCIEVLARAKMRGIVPTKADEATVIDVLVRETTPPARRRRGVKR